MPSLNGKTAMVLGGSRGIGAAIVERLVKDGAKVCFSFHHSIDAAKALVDETGATSVRADSADRIAGLVSYLVGPEAAFVTGALHTIDGRFGA